jgi:hypothetical protein
MTRAQLEHILRASAGITGADQFVVVGSQAVLGQFPNAPQELLISAEADVFTFRSHEDADLIDGSIGEGSPFHKTFGYYAHGVGEETAALPTGWKGRLIRVKTPNTGEATGLCLEVHDLAVCKLVAGREKDLTFISSLLQHRLADMGTIRNRLQQTPMDQSLRDVCLARLARAEREALDRS